MAELDELVLASSPRDAGISCWDLRSGAELLRYRSCSSPPHGLASIGCRFLVSSQLQDSSSSTPSLLYWSWNKPQPEVRSFPVEPIKPVVSNSDGTYIIGGALSGHIFLWEVASGTLLKKWHAHYRAVTCLVFSDDESLLISGAEDGHIKVWSLYRLFDDMGDTMNQSPYEHVFSEHTLHVTDIVAGYGGCNAIILSSSEDRTCKVWSLSKKKLLRTIVFPSIINAVALDPGEYAFYAGGRDGKIYIGALSAESSTNSTYGMHIIGSLSGHSKAVTCLAFSLDGISLISGSEDGTFRVWDTKARHVNRIFKHAKGPINNILVLRKPLPSSPKTSRNTQGSVSRRHLLSTLPPPLDKYINSMDGDDGTRAVRAVLAPRDESLDSQFLSSHVMINQIKELQQQGSSAATEVELERLREDCKRSLQMVQKWKKMYQDLLRLSINELLDEDQKGGNA
ncbi:protein ROOT INITIATION DEFECTIVE 3-like [Magnolia sinica]|uniref:protein ROOT INITIATION DEFECTIVE 3-like n=1 Tax=Magnolia sinica TaxID=86752 RepID=UPI002658077C|nr:protein ROOT INITIATION DEFECTIVE 3-like [Magnolia sinica]